MASVLYQSSQTATGSAATSVTVTKPVSLAVGDVLVAVVANVAGSTQTINTPTGWTSLGKNDTTFTSEAAFYKIADAADVAASGFTFTFAGSVTSFVAGVARFNGNAPSPLDGIDTANASSTTGITPTKTMGTTIILAAGWNGGGSTGSFGSYAIGTANPTWTEAFDTGAGAAKIGIAMAYAGRSAISATGTAQFTATDYSSLKIWVLRRS